MKPLLEAALFHIAKENPNSMDSMPTVGADAPQFSVQDQNGNTIQLSDYLGKKVVLYFYPKDDTPGCTRQACNLRDHHTVLQEKGIVVLGVSADDEATHTLFAEKYQLPFPLLADTDRTLQNAYGVYGERTLYGKKFMGIKRTTFLIDEEGKIFAVIKSPKVDQQTEQILKKWNLNE